MSTDYFDSIVEPSRSRTMTIGQKKIKVEGTYDREIIQVSNPTDAPEPGGPGESACYNGKELNFDIRIGGNHRVAFNKSFFEITGHAATYNGVSETAVPLTTSIPWNSYAALVNQVRLNYNNLGQVVEQVNDRFGHNSMIRALTMYSREYIEGASETYFAPCIESSRDLTTGLSAESQARCRYNLIGGAGGTIQTHKKLLYLSELFETMRLPASPNYETMNLVIRFNPKDKILFSSLGAVDNYYITGLKLYLVYEVFGPSELSNLSNKMNKDVDLAIRQSFWAYDSFDRSYIGPDSYTDSSVRNLQGVVIMIPSNYAADGLGVNPYQYCYGRGAGISSGITSYKFTYDKYLNSPESTMTIDTGAQQQNTFLYFMYRNLCRRISDRELNPALRFVDMARLNTAGSDDISPYVLFCGTFYPTDEPPHRQSKGRELKVEHTTTSAGRMIIMRIRFGMYETVGNGAIGQTTQTVDI